MNKEGRVVWSEEVILGYPARPMIGSIGKPKLASVVGELLGDEVVQILAKARSVLLKMFWFSAIETEAQNTALRADVDFCPVLCSHLLTTAGCHGGVGHPLDSLNCHYRPPRDVV